MDALQDVSRESRVGPQFEFPELAGIALMSMIIRILATRNNLITWMMTVGWLVAQLSVTNSDLFAAQV